MTLRTKLFLALLCLAGLLQAQIPQAVCYQAVAIDDTGNELSDQNVSVRATIHHNAPNGSATWIELHQPTTDIYGLFDIRIGEGAPDGGTAADFSDISWGDGTYFLRIEMDVTGGTDYTLMGVSQMLSVPYALYAEATNRAAYADEALVAQTADTALDDADKNPTNELQALELNGDFLQLSNDPTGTTVDLSTFGGDDADANPQNELQSLVLNGNALLLTNDPNGGGVDLSPLVNDADANPQNELQDLAFDGTNLSLSNAPNTPSVNLSGLINDADANPQNELQSIQLNGSMLSLTNDPSATSIDITTILDDVYPDPTDELQELSFNGSELTISNGNSVNLGDFPFAAPGASMDLPQGMNGEFVVITDAIYHVPDNKVLYITGGPSEITIVLPGYEFDHKAAPSMPIVDENVLVKQCNCVGILADKVADVEPILVDFSLTNSYSVPAGKLLVIKSGLTYDSQSYLRVNGVEMEFFNAGQVRASHLLSFPEGTMIQQSINDNDLIITGYLTDLP